MKLFFLPPVAWLAAIVGIALAHSLYPIVHFEPTIWSAVLAIALFLTGLLISIWHKQKFKKVGTVINTFEQPDE